MYRGGLRAIELPPREGRALSRSSPAGPRVLVTGGSLGIGLAVARRLADDGALVAVAARHRDAIDGALTSLAGDGHLGLELDVADDDGWERALRELDGWGPLGGLVCCAGTLSPVGPIGTYEPAAFLRTVTVNLGGTFLALHHGVPRLRETGGAAVTFSGGGATSPLPRYDAYAASKAAVVRLTENVAAATAPDVRVNCIAPGFVATRMHEDTLAAGPAAAGAEYFERTRREVESGGIPADEVAALVAFLLGVESRPITGKLISVQWDPWRDPEFRVRLARDDALGTMRRIDDMLFTAAQTA